MHPGGVRSAMDLFDFEKSANLKHPIVHVLWISGEASLADDWLRAQCAGLSGMNKNIISQLTCADKASFPAPAIDGMH